jgi:hypothetical protein
VVGEDPLAGVLGVLRPVLADAVPGVDPQVTADALIAAFATEYGCEQPGDAEVLERIEHRDGDALRNLVAAGAAHEGLIVIGGIVHRRQARHPQARRPHPRGIRISLGTADALAQ